jgi:hypothetical protein
MSGGRSGPVPVVTADGRPLKVRPENPGGMQTAGQNEDIMNVGRGPGQLAPPPEAPALQALRQRQAAEEAARQEAARMEAARMEAARQAAMPPQVQPVAVAPNAPPAMQVPSVSAQPPARGAAATPPAAPAAARPVVANAPAPAGKAMVQLAALTTEQAAKQEWQRLAKKMPDVLGSHQPVVTKLERDGKTFYRLRTGGFADQSQATAFCDRVKAKGASCSVSPS